MSRFDPPDHLRCVRTIDAHAAGEPLRIIVDGYPDLEGRTQLERREFARTHHDDLRRALMLEPRGHADMYGCVLTPPSTADGDVGVLFMHNDGYSTMCGHGIIGLVKVGIECGLLSTSLLDPTGNSATIRIDTPAGRVTACAALDDGLVESVSFLNVPSFVLQRDVQVEVEGLATLRCDLAFGGAFYAYVRAEDVELGLEPEEFSRIVEIGMRIKRAVMAQCEIRHPDGDAGLEFLYGTILVGDGGGGVHSRNVCVFAEGEVDRSPTGTGVSGRAAIHHSRGELAIGEWITIESLIRTRFDVRVGSTLRCGDRDAIVPEVRGTAHITGRHEFFIDPDDPLRAGILLR